jgi:hypothetical protein
MAAYKAFEFTATSSLTELLKIARLKQQATRKSIEITSSVQF